jgi:hypothetical protein
MWGVVRRISPQCLSPRPLARLVTGGVLPSRVYRILYNLKSLNATMVSSIRRTRGPRGAFSVHRMALAGMELG